MSAYEQEEHSTHRAARKVDGLLSACEGQMREAERAAEEAAYRAEELKWRIDGRGIRPRRPARRG